VVAASALAVGGCGSDDAAAEPSGPTVAAAELGGTYEVRQLEVAGVEATIDEAGLDGGAVTLTIDAEFGGLRIDTACGTLLGSFTLEADGRAGFTVAGGSTRECSPSAADQRDSLVGPLGRVDTWTTDPPTSGLELTSPAGDSITLERP
jgi:hypothetical protein